MKCANTTPKRMSACVCVCVRARARVNLSVRASAHVVPEHVRSKCYSLMVDRKTWTELNENSLKQMELCNARLLLPMPKERVQHAAGSALKAPRQNALTRKTAHLHANDRIRVKPRLQNLISSELHQRHWPFQRRLLLLRHHHLLVHWRLRLHWHHASSIRTHLTCWFLLNLRHLHGGHRHASLRHLHRNHLDLRNLLLSWRGDCDDWMLPLKVLIVRLLRWRLQVLKEHLWLMVVNMLGCNHIMRRLLRQPARNPCVRLRRNHLLRERWPRLRPLWTATESVSCKQC